jgi:hypothetical protein
MSQCQLVTEKSAEKTKGQPLEVSNAVKKSIVVVKAAFLYLAMARVNGNPKYVMCRDGKCFKKTC